MRYAASRLEEKRREEAYRIYITDSLKMIAENTAKANGGSSMSIRWIDIFKPAEERTSDEIITGIKEKLRKVGESN